VPYIILKNKYIGLGMLKSNKSSIPLLFFICSLIFVCYPLYDYFFIEINSKNNIFQNQDFKRLDAPKLTTAVIKNETINTDETWSGNILVTKSITVSKGATLTILPGTVIKFKNYTTEKICTFTPIVCTPIGAYGIHLLEAVFLGGPT